jgi:hypothetical protein
MKGYIYILINPSIPGMVKIGKTERDPSTRVSELSSATGVPQKFILVYQREVNDCDFIERSIHSELTERGVRFATNREFFEIEVTEAINFVINLCDEIDVELEDEFDEEHHEHTSYEFMFKYPLSWLFYERYSEAFDAVDGDCESLSEMYSLITSSLSSHFEGSNIDLNHILEFINETNIVNEVLPTLSIDNSSPDLVFYLATMSMTKSATPISLFLLTKVIESGSGWKNLQFILAPDAPKYHTYIEQTYLIMDHLSEELDIFYDKVCSLSDILVNARQKIENLDLLLSEDDISLDDGCYSQSFDTFRTALFLIKKDEGNQVIPDEEAENDQEQSIGEVYFYKAIDYNFDELDPQPLKAIKYYEKAIEFGHIKAYYHYGRLLQMGNEPELKKNLQKSFKILMLGVRNGDDECLIAAADVAFALGSKEKSITLAKKYLTSQGFNRKDRHISSLLWYLSNLHWKDLTYYKLLLPSISPYKHEFLNYFEDESIDQTLYKDFHFALLDL